MAINVKALLKDKKVLGVVGVGAALGAYTLYKKNKSGTASGAATTTTSGTGYTTGSLGSYDSTATDAYSNIQNSVDNQLAGFGQQLSNLQDQLSSLPPGGSATGTPSGTTSAAVLPWKAENIYTAASVANRFGISVDQLQAANPGQNVRSGVARNVTINVPVTATNASAFKWIPGNA